MATSERRSFWNRVAFLYSGFMKKNQSLYEDSCTYIVPYLDKNDHVLELACGTGQFSVPLAHYVKNWTATDFSEKMVEQCQKSCGQTDITFAVADAMHLPYEDHQFDAVLIANALHIMPNPTKVLLEIKRVLKPGGMLIAPTFLKNETSSIRMGILGKIGFQTLHAWTETQFVSFVKTQGFAPVAHPIVESNPLSECVLIAVNRVDIVKK